MVFIDTVQVVEETQSKKTCYRWQLKQGDDNCQARRVNDRKHVTTVCLGSMYPTVEKLIILISRRNYSVT